MARVIDYAFGRPSIDSLKAAGAIAVCRYFSWLPNSKCLSRAEADALLAGGIDIVSNWEYYGDWRHDYSGGFAHGAIHATEAQKQHLDCGGPLDRPIYFSTDFAPAPSQLSTIGDYYKGVASVIGVGRTGAYGSYSAIKYLFDNALITWGWQTYAWSNGQWEPRAQLRQISNGVLVGGVDCDLNDSRSADFGQWGMQKTGGEFMATASDVIMAWSTGMPHTPDGTAVSPVQWRIRDEAWQAAITKMSNDLAITLAATKAGEDALMVAVKALAEMVASGGGSVDTAAVIAAIKAASDEAASTAAELADEIAALRQHNLDLQGRLNAALVDPARTEESTHGEGT